MFIRQAHIADIQRLSEIRLAVRENPLNNPALVTYADYVAYLTQRGRGWVAEAGGQPVGFAIVDLQDHSVWALFVHPDYDRRGIGRALHDEMLSWYFTHTTTPVWLSTAPGTRAEGFYRRASWQETGRTSRNEIRFEMTAAQWLASSAANGFDA
jgi:GNAT superfamily N-acetyltransferase